MTGSVEGAQSNRAKRAQRFRITLIAAAIMFFVIGGFCNNESTASENDPTATANTAQSMPSIEWNSTNAVPVESKEEETVTARTMGMWSSEFSSLLARLADQYNKTPPGDRIAWGGILACSVVAISILFERLVRLRARRIVPVRFTANFLDRLHEGKLDAGRALDYCEQNPSPAARVALAAVRRWGRPPADLERAMALAHRVESEKLRRNIGTLRRISAIAPLIGLLGTLLAAGRALAGTPVTESGFVAGTGLGADLASSLAPLIAGVVVATLTLVIYDGLMARIERLASALDRLGAETIDAIAMSVRPTEATLGIPTAYRAESGEKPSPSSLRFQSTAELDSTGILGLIRSNSPRRVSAPHGRVPEQGSHLRSKNGTTDRSARA